MKARVADLSRARARARSIGLVSLVGLVVIAGLIGCTGASNGPPGAKPSSSASTSPASSPPARSGSPTPSTARGVPAWLEPGVGEACYEQIAAVVEKETANRVLIGPAAFSTSDELVLVREPKRGPDGKPLDGRASMPRPAVFHLSWSANQCLIASAKQGAEHVALPACRCVPRDR